MASSFETSIQRLLQRFRREDGQGQNAPVVPIGYIDAENVERAVRGDEDALYAHSIGRASATGTAAVQVAAGEAQRLLVDLDGKLWTRSAAGSLYEVVGNVAHDEADAGNPVKVGARAAASTAGHSAVSVDDRVDLAADVNGRLIVVSGDPATNQAVVGNVAHDEVDSGNPVKIGARAVGSLLGFSAVGVGDRVDLAANVRGQLQVALAGGAQWSKFNSALGAAADAFDVALGACLVGRISVTPGEATAMYALVYDGSGGELVDRFYVPASGTSVRDYTTEGGLDLANGCYVVLSTSASAIAPPTTGGFLHAITQST